MIRTMLLAALALGSSIAGTAEEAGGASRRQPSAPALGHGGLGENIRVGGLVVRPLAVIEDSRCPEEVDCAWAGQLVLRIAVSGMTGEQRLSTIRPLALRGGGQLALESVQPPRRQNQVIRAYRFTFRRR